MELFATIFIFGCVGLAAFGIMQTSHQASQKADVSEKLKSLEGFSPSQTIVKTGLSTLVLKGVSVDAEEKKICIIVGDILHVVPFSKVLEAEVIVDGATVTKTSRGSQAVGVAVGAVLGGGVGAIIGGLSASSSDTQKIKGVFLRLVLNDLEYPAHEIELIELTNTGSTPPKVALKEAEHWNNIMKVVIHQSKEPELPSVAV